MKRAIRRFVSQLNGINRVYFIILVIIGCILSLAIGIYIQFFYAYYDTDPFMLGINVGVQKTQEEYDLLRQEFYDLFNNQFTGEIINEDDIEKIYEDQNVIYTAYNLVNEDESFYSVNVQVPTININSKVIKSINSEIKSEYYDRANYIMRQTEGKVLYNVTYTSYINNDIISIAIKTVIKEEEKSERVQLKTYTYSISKDKLLTLEDVIKLKETTVENVQKTINDEIQKEYNKAQIIATEYGNVYERDLENTMYNVNASTNFFLTNDGYVYILYPYGNDNDTNEIDIVIF